LQFAVITSYKNVNRASEFLAGELFEIVRSVYSYDRSEDIGKAEMPVVVPSLAADG
jgi:hypothetical protein